MPLQYQVMMLQLKNQQHNTPNDFSHELATLGQPMQVPVLRTTAMQVPYLSPDQTPGLTKAINTIVRQMRVTTAQCQAVRAQIVTLRTVPLNV